MLIFFEAAFACIYHDQITYSIVYILLETNVAEAGQYLNVYLNSKIITLILVFLIPSVFILIAVNKAIHRYTLSDYFGFVKTGLHKGGKWIKHLSVLAIILISSSIYISAGHFKHHVFNKMIKGYTLYHQEVERYNNFLHHSDNSTFLQHVVNQDDDQKQTLVVIIGEATARNHMGLYGYYRNTTPRLKQMSDALLFFEDVISPHANTIASLEKVLTFGSTAHPEDVEKGSIVQLAQKAGYKTYWISNQIPLGLYETLVTMIGKTTDRSFFTNLGSAEVQSSYDENLFPFIQLALDEQVNKKIIFVHILGTHSVYDWRYPEAYNVFTDAPRTPYPSERATQAINTYDNAVLYNDYIVSSIIKMLENNTQKNATGQLVYFSDHGEEVYETINFEGHAEPIATYPMYEIPFIYWTNQSDKKEAYSSFTKRKYMTDDLIYSIADLMNIQFEGRDDSKSVFSNSFISKPRIVKGDQDFDLQILAKK